MKTTIIIPAYNEELTIEQTIVDFHEAAPDAVICVVDNNSSDKTGEIVRTVFARIASADSASTKNPKNVSSPHQLIFEPRQGKSNAVRTAFMQVESDVYVMVDADATYSGKDLPALLQAFGESRADMVVGDRHSSGDYGQENTRPMHGFGNNLVRDLINFIFRVKLHDILSGYRVFSRRYVKSFPILSSGFELEVEMTMHALRSRLAVVEHAVSYKERPANSFSKLNTVSDGFRVLLKIFNIVRYSRPLLFFGLVSLFFLLTGLVVGSVPVIEFIQTGFIKHFPMAILAVGLVVCGMLSFAAAVILDMLAYVDRKLSELRLLQLS
ncbi:MAG: glycosyltransferase family 2 protein [Puniceicoccales bacterium]|nr:glycosyltransferase family 2 protein [Puniceicoccales bacterium]